MNEIRLYFDFTIGCTPNIPFTYVYYHGHDGAHVGRDRGPTSLQRVETPEAMDGWKLEYSFPFGALNGLFFGGRNGC